MSTEPEAPTPLWKAQLKHRTNKVTGERELVPCFENVTVVLSNDSDFKGRFARNEFSGVTELRSKLDCARGMAPPRLGPLDEYMVSYVRFALTAQLRMSVGVDTAIQGIEAAARQNCFHPLRDYLRDLQWDGTRRIHAWLTSYLGVEPTDVSAAVGQWWLISAVARAFRPGCQADHMLILEGPQGAGKSTAIGILGGDWYVAKLPPVREYAKAAHAMAGAWIVEMGELDAVRGAAASQVKDFMSLAEDRYQPPYGRFVIRQPRTCVFVGTTNDSHYLRDPTGARRFWPVTVGRIDRQSLARDRDQLWAEARIAFEDGATWHPDGAMLKALGETQAERHEVDDWENRIATWLDQPNAVAQPAGLGPIAEPHDGVTTGEVLQHALGVTPRDWTHDAQTRVGTALRRLGWTVKQQREQGVRARRYYR